MREDLKHPDSGDFVWRRLQYVFGLDDPATFPELSLDLTDDERELLERFIAQARTLAGTTLLGEGDTVGVNITDLGDGAEVETSFSDPDITTGFMVLLRQCYSVGEEASFAKVREVLGRRLHETGQDELAQVIKAWRKAHARLMNQTLEELVQEQMVVDKLMPGELEDPEGNSHSGIVRGTDSPKNLLLVHWYGGQIHWGEQRKARATLEQDPVMGALADLEARQAATDLAFFYTGFALVVERILAAS
jgi:hypothetical protein